MSDIKAQLEEITRILIDTHDNYGELYAATNRLYELFLSVTDVEMDSFDNREHVYLEQGKAIGVFWAGMCVKEIMRTKRFVSGLYEGIKAAREKFPGTPIHIVYAGTGPFATLAIPMTVLFTSNEINFTFLEINPESKRLVENVVKAFQADDYVNEIILCDAANYRYDKDRPIHMVVSETMQNALQKEPQVAITLNLVKQMHQDGILIPQNIVIDAVLMNPKKNAERITSLEGYQDKYYHQLATVFELNKDIHKTYCNRGINTSVTNDGEASMFPEVEVAIPGDIEAGFSDLNLFTKIQVYGDVYVNYWECSLSLPKKIMNFDPNMGDVTKVSFRYEIGEKPGFVCKVTG